MLMTGLGLMVFALCCFLLSRWQLKKHPSLTYRGGSKEKKVFDGIIGVGLLALVAGIILCLVVGVRSGHRKVDECIQYEVKRNGLHPLAAYNRCVGD